MSDVIQLLPDSVANQIAAGEVIQRPASVVKELVENAVDAGADRIQIILRDGGKNLIQVIDNGCGMSDRDARMAFERHATSKISKAADLFALHTMGFRGEALPSIASVAQVDLITMQKGESMGTHLEIAASKVVQQSPKACEPGTNLSVKNLFFNFPARRKYLKKDANELTHIMHEFERLALVNPGISFTLIHNDTVLHQLLPGSLKQRIVSLFGKSLDKQLIPVSTETSLVKITGFVSSPENARKRNALQYFFVNGRNMMHPYFRKAVLHCYENLIPADTLPGYFLNFEVDPATIDVNVHPTKSEIKFEHEAPIWQILVAAIKEALGRFNAMPAIDFESTDRFEIPAFHPTADADFGTSETIDYNPFAPENSGGRQKGTAHSTPRKQASSLNDWEKLYDGFRTDVQPDDFLSPAAVEASILNGDENADEQTALPIDDTATPLPSLLMLKQKYLVIPSHTGLIIVDRTRAHIKVLYEQNYKDGNLTGGASQQVLFPELVRLTATQNVVMSTMTAQLRSLGFEIENIGDNTWAVNAIPPILNNSNVEETLLRMIDDVASETQSRETTLEHKVALAMARSAAIQPGQPFTMAEAEALLSALFSLPDPNYTPTGQPVFYTIDMDQIALKFQT